MVKVREKKLGRHGAEGFAYLGIVQAYDDIEQGADYLTWLRSK